MIFGPLFVGLTCLLGWMWSEPDAHPSPTVTVMMLVWGLILIPWLPFFTLMGTGMAFEGGYTFRAYSFVVVAWAYPAFVAVAYLFRKKNPKLIWLPLLPLIPAFASFFTNKLI